MAGGKIEACIVKLSSVSRRSSGLNDLSFEFRHGQETLFQNIHTGHGGPHSLLFNGHQRVYSVSTQWPGLVDQCPPRSGGVTNEWSYTSTHTTCPHGAGRDSKFYEQRNGGEGVGNRNEGGKFKDSLAMKEVSRHGKELEL
jgi:hypothetical protein